MAQMSRTTFFDGITMILRRELPPELQRFHTRRFGHLLKIYYDNERIHYEVWVDSRRQQIELGLHLEDGPASTISILHLLDQHILEIKDVLGPDVEFGRWTQSWGHVIENRPLGALDASERSAVASRLALYISTLEPILASDS
ncbi:MAG: hypothetical protein AB7V46_03050 [Thermomicrobiales bacterium]